jgi:hypothetical protein
MDSIKTPTGIRLGDIAEVLELQVQAMDSMLLEVARDAQQAYRSGTHEWSDNTDLAEYLEALRALRTQANALRSSYKLLYQNW